ncbi:acyl carrier protein [Cryobacterium sp. TMT1-66-1]|uniref:acyl carrier protein n=1 Tax=Cryobacterium sp. TMT1-66-1 TaxID=1259242 RepID=UPI00106CFAC8|nr:acyl carrier protein [Cryobacterium sp. TMT1-66-1]TFD06320.1 acyl carrier protein [Cryobacterium sp. TMT1-66-1]
MKTIVPTSEHIASWIISRVAAYGEIDPGTFTVDTSLADLGFNSVYALTLCGDIEDAYDIDVDPTIIWDHPTIRGLASAVHEKIGHV